MRPVLAIKRRSGEEMKLYRQEIIHLLSCFAADNYAMDRLVYRAARSLGILVSSCTVAPAVRLLVLYCKCVDHHYSLLYRYRFVNDGSTLFMCRVLTPPVSFAADRHVSHRTCNVFRSCSYMLHIHPQGYFQDEIA